MFAGGESERERDEERQNGTERKGGGESERWRERQTDRQTDRQRASAPREANAKCTGQGGIAFAAILRRRIAGSTSGFTICTKIF